MNEIRNLIQPLAGEYKIWTLTCCSIDSSDTLEVVTSRDLNISVFKYSMEVEALFIQLDLI